MQNKKTEEKPPKIAKTPTCQKRIKCCIIRRVQNVLRQRKVIGLFKKIKWRPVLIVGAVVYLTINLISAQFELMTKKQEYWDLEQQQRRLQLKIADTQSLIDNADDALYIERIAREKLGYAYPGETIYIDIQSQ